MRPTSLDEFMVMFCMTMHERLGIASVFHGLSQDNRELIFFKLKEDHVERVVYILEHWSEYDAFERWIALQHTLYRLRARMLSLGRLPGGADDIDIRLASIRVLNNFDNVILNTCQCVEYVPTGNVVRHVETWPELTINEVVVDIRSILVVYGELSNIPACGTYLDERVSLQYLSNKYRRKTRFTWHEIMIQAFLHEAEILSRVAPQ
jgi:hypothetical protein